MIGLPFPPSPGRRGTPARARPERPARAPATPSLAAAGNALPDGREGGCRHVDGSARAQPMPQAGASADDGAPADPYTATLAACLRRFNIACAGLSAGMIVIFLGWFALAEMGVL